LIAGTLMLTSMLVGAAGPWETGALHDTYGSYAQAFTIAIGCCALLALAIWLAAPRKVRAATGQLAEPMAPSASS
jgi:cyanate permease